MSKRRSATLTKRTSDLRTSSRRGVTKSALKYWQRDEAVTVSKIA